MDCYSPIGIFDSGAGGVSVLREAVRALKNERFIYYGDSFNAPYGTKSNEEVIALSLRVVEHLIQMDAKAIVIACNTATAAAAEHLRQAYSLPIIGMEPALKPAAQMRKEGIVLVLATPTTLHSQKYAALFSRYGDNAISLPCPGLMEFVERREIDSPALHSYFAALLAPYLGAQVDAVVMGCTHYVFLEKALARHFSPATHIIDGNKGTVRQLRARLEALNLLSDKAPQDRVQLLTSGDEAALQTLKTLYAL